MSDQNPVNYRSSQSHECCVQHELPEVSEDDCSQKRQEQLSDMKAPISVLLKHTALLLKEKSTTPSLDAQVLCAHVLQKDRSYLFSHGEESLSELQYQHFIRLRERAADGEPIAYCVGSCEFWSLNFHVNSQVLIPRPETESLLAFIFERFSEEKNWRVLDCGTGSGAMACAIAHERSDWQVTALDKSSQALSVAKANAKRLNVKVDFLQSDWFSQLPSFLSLKLRENHSSSSGSSAAKHAGASNDNLFQLMVANPPYIAATETTYPGARFEPKAALYADENGFSDLRCIINNAHHYLSEGGILCLEHGCYGQDQVINMLRDSGHYKLLHSGMDDAAIPRFVVAQCHYRP